MSSNQRHVYGLILTLLVLGSSVFLYRHLVLDVPLSETENINSWTVEANLRFVADPKAPVKASFTIPYRTPWFTILDEYFISRNYGVTTNLSSYNRHVIWSLRRSSGPQSLYYRGIFRETDLKEISLPKPAPLKPMTLSDEIKTAVDTAIDQARQSSADIQTFAQSTIKALNTENDNAKLLVGNHFTDATIVQAAITVLAHAKIHAMPVQGMYLGQKSKAEFSLLLAVYNEKEWVYIHPRTGASGLPKMFLIWQYGNEPVFSLQGGKKPQFILTISPTSVNALSMVKARGLDTESTLMRFSLLQLPIDVQATYKILLTVPIGTFIILLLRNFVGIATFGTFMPVLIALAFRETQVIWGILLFTTIVSFGLMVRFYLNQLHLLIVPRLATILTVVILLMAFISILCQNLGINAGLSVALFPMVILTMTIERMCITWDERGAANAIKSGVGSLAAAVLCFWVMSNTALQYLLFAFPELLLVLLALILWFGQYRGYRLVELFRFKALANQGV